MNQNNFQIVRSTNLNRIELQLVLQCAPLFSGLKISNLFIIDEKENFENFVPIFNGSEISVYYLVHIGNRKIFLLYKKDLLNQYLMRQDVNRVMENIGYGTKKINESLNIFLKRYQYYLENRNHFPHEMGLFLGYPVEDVEGFIYNQGKNYLCTGYWKVYKNLQEKKLLFQKFDYVKEIMTLLIYQGAGITDILDTFRLISIAGDLH